MQVDFGNKITTIDKQAFAAYFQRSAKAEGAPGGLPGEATVKSWKAALSAAPQPDPARFQAEAVTLKRGVADAGRHNTLVALSMPLTPMTAGRWSKEDSGQGDRG